MTERAYDIIVRLLRLLQGMADQAFIPKGLDADDRFSDEVGR